MVNQIKTLCYDMLLDIIDVAEKDEGSNNVNISSAAGGLATTSVNRS